MVDLGENIEHLNQDEACEGNAHNVHEGVVKPDYCEDHDSCTLEYRNPDPYQEGFEIQ